MTKVMVTTHVSNALLPFFQHTGILCNIVLSAHHLVAIYHWTRLPCRFNSSVCSAVWFGKGWVGGGAYMVYKHFLFSSYFEIMALILDIMLHNDETQDKYKFLGIWSFRVLTL